MFAVLAGAMIGGLAFYARYNPSDVAVVFNPLATMFSWAAASYPQLAIGDTFFSADRLEFLAEAVAGVIAKRTFILSPSSRPTIFVEWFVIAATVVAVRRGEWRLVFQVAARMLTDWGVDILGMSRGLKLEYFILTDPLAIIAAALLISNLTDLQSHRWTYPLGVALIVANIAVSQAEPVKHTCSSTAAGRRCAIHWRPRPITTGSGIFHSAGRNRRRAVQLVSGRSSLPKPASSSRRRAIWTSSSPTRMRRGKMPIEPSSTLMF
jgi:hypothetical protein